MALKALVNHSLGGGVTEGYVQMTVSACASQLSACATRSRSCAECTGSGREREKAYKNRL